MPHRPPIHNPNHAKLVSLANERDRGSPSARGYDAAWRRFRQRIVSERPLCQDCLERDLVTASRELHHIAKVRDRPELRLADGNVRALCSSCHSTRTARGE